MIRIAITQAAFGSLIARASTSPSWGVEGAGIARPACPSSR